MNRKPRRQGTTRSGTSSKAPWITPNLDALLSDFEASDAVRLRHLSEVQPAQTIGRLPDGTAVLDGYPIVWTDVLTPYGTSAAADQPLAVFGALSFWWLGEHGSPRIDTSEHVWFANDQLAVRFIEEIDFDYAAVDATAALITAAS